MRISHTIGKLPVESPIFFVLLHPKTPRKLPLGPRMWRVQQRTVEWIASSDRTQPFARPTWRRPIAGIGNGPSKGIGDYDVALGNDRKRLTWLSTEMSKMFMKTDNEDRRPYEMAPNTRTGTVASGGAVSVVLFIMRIFSAGYFKIGNKNFFFFFGNGICKMNGR